MAITYLVANAHIDPIWLWRWSEGQQVIRSTFASAVELLREREDVIFTASSASFYKVVEETDPALFERIRELVKEGRWQIVGGWWVEPDCNIPSGEALVRHSLYGQRYFMEKFGVKARVGYNVDSFGHNAAMPQILKKSGINYYIFMRPGPHEKVLPYWVFRWLSPDGSEVIAHRIVQSYLASGDRIRRLVEDVMRELRAPLDALFCFVGKGDHGGGLTPEDLKILDELAGKVKPHELKFAPLHEFFKRAEQCRESLPLVVEELQHHASGCYSALSKVKMLNRAIEEALVVAEKYNFMANVLVGMDYLKEDLHRAWTNLLFCQFHDVLAGTCIRDAYEKDVYPMLEEALSIANRISERAIQSLASRIEVKEESSVIVFNPHAFPVKAPIEVNWVGEGLPSALSEDEGGKVECQSGRGDALAEGIRKLIFVADLPPLGYKVFSPSDKRQFDGKKCELSVGKDFMENKWLRVEFDEKVGFLKRLVIKDLAPRVLIEGAKAVVLKDESDTWGHGVFRFDEVIGEFSPESLSVIEAGPIRAVIRTTQKYQGSKIVLDFILYRDLDYLLCRAQVNWTDARKMLKLAFPLKLDKTEATYEIQYGSVKRPCDGEEEPGLRWVDVTGEIEGEEKWGLTLVNDSKYSYDVSDNVLRLTVLRSPPYAHHEPVEVEREAVVNYIDQGTQSISFALRPHAGHLRVWEAARLADLMTAPPRVIREFRHNGKLPPIRSLLKVSNDDVILKVIKRSEDSSGWILRMYETCGGRAGAEVDLSALNVRFTTELGPHEIKTFSVDDTGAKVKELNLIEEEIFQNPPTQ